MRKNFRKTLLPAVEGAIVTATMLAPAMGSAQAASQPATFEVASIRKNVGNIGTCSPDQMQATTTGFHMTNCPLIMAVAAAYVPTTGEALGYLAENRIVGMPDWLTQERYDVDARIGESDVKAWRDPTQQKQMLHAMMQTLLAERCHWVSHLDYKDKSIYALVVGKSGSKLKASAPDDAETVRAKHPGAVAIPGEAGFYVQTRGSIDLYNASTGTLTLLLARLAGRPIVDKTGLPGKYDMHLDFGQPGPPAADGSVDPGASIFSVVQEQLGLKLESRKDQVETLVIDHVERPTAN